MKRKHIGLYSLILLAALIAAGCGGQKKEAVTQDTQPQQTAQADAVTAASTVTDEESLHRAASANGTWIVILVDDMTVNRDIILEGEFKERDAVAREIALYSQDANRNVAQRFTLTAPRLIVRSENARIAGGTFVGDVYVESNGFRVIDATVRGNVYFANESFMSTFKTEDGGQVTGETAVKPLGG